nr:MAG TPA: hypothetical protein [Caudoviricetes sp.]
MHHLSQLKSPLLIRGGSETSLSSRAKSCRFNHYHPYQGI